MSNDKNDSSINFILFTLLFLFSSRIIKCLPEEDNSISICSDNDDSLNNEHCFNNILKFENYKVNHFAKNNNGDFIVEFTKYTENDEISSFRRFYGLTNDGQSFFSDESPYTKGFAVNIDEGTYDENLDFSLEDSKNLFVSIYNNRYNQYLFSINAYNSII